MSSEILWVNGIDPASDLGLTLHYTEIDAWGSGLEYERSYTSTPGLFSNSPAPFGTVRPRTIRITVLIENVTIATRDAALALVTDAFQGELELRFGDSPDKVLDGIVIRDVPRPEQPRKSFYVPEVLAAFDVICHNPTRRDQVLRRVGFGSTRGEVELGTAPTEDYDLYIMGQTGASIVITQRDAGGNPIGDPLTLSVTLGATEYLKINGRYKTIKKYTAGVESDANSVYTSGDFPNLDPGYGSYAMSAPGTLECSGLGTNGGCLIDYFRRWRN